MSSEIRSLTFALLNPDTAAAAATALSGIAGKEAVDGLVGLLSGPHSAPAGVAAVRALQGRPGSDAIEGFAAALRSSHATVRQAATDALRGEVPRLAGELVRVVRSDGSWPVRRSALLTLADWPSDHRWAILHAATDPHWRVRNELIKTLLQWGEDPDTRDTIEERLRAELSTESALRTARRVGLHDFLAFRWRGTHEATLRSIPMQPPPPISPVTDPDPLVILREWQQLPRSAKKALLRVCPQWMTSREPRLVSAAIDALREWGDAAVLLETAALLDDPRTGAFEPVLRLLASLDAERTEHVARAILSRADMPPAALVWGLDQFGVVFSFASEEPVLSALLREYEKLDQSVGTALVGLTGRWQAPKAAAWLASLAAASASPALRLASLSTRFENGHAPDPNVLEPLLADRDDTIRATAFALALRSGVARDRWSSAIFDQASEVRLAVAKQAVAFGPPAGELLEAFASDPDLRVRAASLTPDRAARLVKDPETETSWHVLARAAVIARVPFWKLAPSNQWQPVTSKEPELQPLLLPAPAPAVSRRLGPGELRVFPMGVSGHYGLPVEGFARAAEAGVNLFFWEPDYRSLSRFIRRLPAARRDDFHIVAGTFEAEPRRVRADAERALQTLGIERISVFLLFWVQSWGRASPEVRGELERMRARGMIGSYGLSTHSRALALEAIDAGWNPIMVRHSAAHPGAELEVLPRAVETATSILTFSNTCYGRLLRAGGGEPGVSAADCYRYTLSQPGVRACFSAPGTLEQLEENLSAVRDPDLSEDRRARLLARGAALYQEEAIFRRCVRSR